MKREEQQQSKVLKRLLLLVYHFHFELLLGSCWINERKMGRPQGCFRLRHHQVTHLTAAP